MLPIISDDDNNVFKMEEGNVYYNGEVRNVGGGFPPYTYETKTSREILNIFLQVQKP